MAFPDSIRLATSANIDAANTFLNTTRGGGGTELYAAVQRLVIIPNPDKRQWVYVFLTDGFITNDDSILGFLEKQNPVPQIFAFGAGDNLNCAFLDGVSAIGCGFSTELTSTEDATLVANLAWTRIQSPQLTNISLNFGTMNVSDTILPLARSLYQGMMFTAYGKSNSTGMQTVTLSGLVNGQTVSYAHSFDLSQSNSLAWSIPKLWARQKIALLEQQDDEGFNQKDSIVAVSIAYPVLSKYTAFIAYQASAEDTINWGSASEVKHINAKASAFSWNSFKLNCSTGQIQFVWDDAQTVNELRVFDLKGHLLFV